jgi:hypothetical protein
LDKGKYVLIGPEELKKLRPGANQAIDIDGFIQPEALDPLYFTDRTYYLAPDGKVGQGRPGGSQNIGRGWCRKSLQDFGQVRVAHLRAPGRPLRL